jgi:hypothetical protein
MDTVTFRSVLEGVAIRQGTVPGELQPTQSAAIVEYINSAVRTAWQMDGWWPWVVREPRRWRQTWVVSEPYDEGVEIWHEPSQKYWLAVASVSPGEVPGVSASWEEITDLEAYLHLEEVGYERLGDLLSVSDARGAECAFLLRGERAYVDPAPAVPWVTFTKRRPVFTATEWSSTVTYVPGNVVYRPALGECFAPVQQTTGQVPESNPSVWERQTMPEILGEYVKLAAYADTLREDGQVEKAAVQDMRAEKELDRQFDRVALKMSQTRRFAVNR